MLSRYTIHHDALRAVRRGACVDGWVGVHGLLATLVHPTQPHPSHNEPHLARRDLLVPCVHQVGQRLKCVRGKQAGVAVGRRDVDLRTCVRGGEGGGRQGVGWSGVELRCGVEACVCARQPQMFTQDSGRAHVALRWEGGGM